MILAEYLYLIFKQLRQRPEREGRKKKKPRRKKKKKKNTNEAREEILPTYYRR